MHLQHVRGKVGEAIYIFMRGGEWIMLGSTPTNNERTKHLYNELILRMESVITILYEEHPTISPLSFNLYDAGIFTPLSKAGLQKVHELKKWLESEGCTFPDYEPALKLKDK